MSSVTTYTCDRCGHEQHQWDRATRAEDGDARQMWSVGVVVEHTRGLNSPYTSARIRDRYIAEWCDNCVRAVGLVGPERPAETASPPPPTLEDLIRDIVHEEVEQA